MAHDENESTSKGAIERTHSGRPTAAKEKTPASEENSRLSSPTPFKSNTSTACGLVCLYASIHRKKGSKKPLKALDTSQRFHT